MSSDSYTGPYRRIVGHLRRVKAMTDCCVEARKLIQRVKEDRDQVTESELSNMLGKLDATIQMQGIHLD